MRIRRIVTLALLTAVVALTAAAEATAAGPVPKTVAYAGQTGHSIGSSGEFPLQGVSEPVYLRGSSRSFTVTIQVFDTCPFRTADGRQQNYDRLATLVFRNVHPNKRTGKFSAANPRQTTASGDKPFTGLRLTGRFGRDEGGHVKPNSVAGFFVRSLTNPTTGSPCVHYPPNAWSATKRPPVSPKSSALTVTCPPNRNSSGGILAEGTLAIGGAGQAGRTVAIELHGPPFGDGKPNYPGVILRKTLGGGAFGILVGYPYVAGSYTEFASFVGSVDAKPAQTSCPFEVAFQ